MFLGTVPTCRPVNHVLPKPDEMVEWVERLLADLVDRGIRTLVGPNQLLKKLILLAS